MAKETIEDIDNIQPDEWLISKTEFKCKGPYLDSPANRKLAIATIQVYDSGRVILKCDKLRRYGDEKTGRCFRPTENGCSCPFDVLRNVYMKRGRIL